MSLVQALYCKVKELCKDLADIELTPGPQGEQGEAGAPGLPGAPGQDGVDNIVTVTSCTGPFKRSTGRTGWLAGWTTPATDNVANVTTDWIPVSTAQTSPACVTDMNVHVDFGVFYYQLRRMRLRQTTDWRLLVNGAAVITETFDEYNYLSAREDTNPDVIAPLDVRSRPMGHSAATRLNVPAGASVQVQVRYRHNFTGAQSSAYGRLIQGLRSQATFDFTPRTLVTGVKTS